MRYRQTFTRIGLFGLCLLTGCLSHENQKVGQSQSAAEAAREARIAWWREARFGMFIHWGLYAIPAGQWGEVTTHGEWIRDTAQIPIAEYDRFLAEFNPVQFNADAWVALAKDAGMKYIVITAKHHDGFCLFDSKYTDFDVMATPFKRDIIRELSEACAKAGIRFCVYYSIMDWHHPDYLPRRPWEKAERPVDGAELDRYIAYMKNQLRELLTNYGPIGVLWFDGQWEGSWTNARGEDLEAFIRSIQPDIVINSRIGRGGGTYGIDRSQGGLGDYGTPEQFIPDAAIPGVDWETCMTMNDHWGYNKHDANWKSNRQLVGMLTEVASKGGNFLLNVGPTAEGLIPPPSVERLRYMGAWLETYGESIYGTRAGPFKQAFSWGHCTQRTLANGDTRLYSHVVNPPADGRLVLDRLLNRPKQAYLLAAEPAAKVEARQLGSGVEVTLPPLQPTTEDVVVVLDLEGTADVGDPPEIVADYEVFTDSLEVTIRSDQANVEPRYTTDDSEPTAESPCAVRPLRLTRTCSVRARAFRGDRPVSPTAGANFTKVLPRPASKPGGLVSGLAYQYFEGQFASVRELASLTPKTGGVADTFSTAPAEKDHLWALRFEGFVDVPKTGPYRFFVRSDDGSCLWISDDLVVNNDGPHSPLEKSGVVALEAGFHPIRVEMFEQTGGSELVVSWDAPGLTKQPISAASLWRRP